LLANTLKTTASSVALPALEKTQGYIIAISLVGGQQRVPGKSDGCISKHVMNRLVESVALGKASSFLFVRFLFRETDLQNHRRRAPERSHVCACARLSSYTRIAAETGSLGINRGGAGIILDTAAHPTATMPYLTSGRADRLSGRFVHFTFRLSYSSCSFFYYYY
jgi:NAD(P)-dependent dehydrogenase (short-subunit alcohol dehydrogenase family)